MWKPAEALGLSAAQRADLDALVRSGGKTPQRVVARALIILAAADGKPINAIAHDSGSVGPRSICGGLAFNRPVWSA